jgi:phytoene/squalene synthetase
VSDQAALEAFLDKWRARWPEWRIAEVFVPARERAKTLAWLALRQELADAAWEGADPLPGAAKLTWWNDELRGWTQGRRRHPLGLALQRVAAPWDALADALPVLEAAREVPLQAGEGVASLHATLAPFAVAGEGVSAAIAADAGRPAAPSGADIPAGALAAILAAMRAMARDGEPGAAKALLGAWPSRPNGVRVDRIFAALARDRLRALPAQEGPRNLAPSHWHVLWAAWRAGRSIPRA